MQGNTAEGILCLHDDMPRDTAICHLRMISSQVFEDASQPLLRQNYACFTGHRKSTLKLYALSVGHV